MIKSKSVAIFLIVFTFIYLISCNTNGDNEKNIIKQISIFYPEEINGIEPIDTPEPPSECIEVMSSNIYNSQCFGEDIKNICNSWGCQLPDTSALDDFDDPTAFYVFYFACKTVSCNELQCDDVNIIIDNLINDLEIIANYDDGNSNKLICFPVVY
ncbi:MAG: hypothetical protein GTO02_07030 [Candidatus Dadabacteria bacterium]|nr:hypothetical protein [Candidatus Dadabacteria bacterium]NIQ14148.1 hypothetical protein [Candidatus Dadabacteria bacterium]